MKCDFRLELLVFDAWCKLKAELATSYFGWLWWIIEPVATILAYYFVFGFLLRRGSGDYIYQLIIGVVLWGWFSATVTKSSQSIQRSAALILQVKINKLFFPLSDVLQMFFRQVFVFAILFMLLPISGYFYNSWWWLPILVLEFALFTCVFSLWLAALIPFFPDAFGISNMFMRLWMFCSGVFYTVDMISEGHQALFLMNPLANLIEQFRDVLLVGKPPEIISIVAIMSCCIIFLSLVIVFVRTYDQLYPRLVMR